MNLISYAEASEIKGISRQGIRVLSKSKWAFMVDGQVDKDHPDWKCYLAGVDPGTAPAKKTSAKKSKPVRGPEAGKKIVAKKKPIPKLKSNVVKQNISYNKNEYQNLSLRDRKIYTEIQKMNIEIHARLGELIDRKIIKQKIEAIGQAIQSSFVDYARRVSPRITSKLKAIGMEKEVEKIIGKDMQEGLQEVKRVVMDALR